MSKEDDFQSILENGISFGRGGGPRQESGKVKTKAKKKKYITGALIVKKLTPTSSTSPSGE